MKSTKKGIVLSFVLALAATSVAAAEPTYLIYPNAPTTFRFDASRYELVTPGNARFDAAYAIGNQMLWDRSENRVPIEIYRAPFIQAFEQSPTGQNEYVVFSNDFNIIVDGFAHQPRTIGSLCLRFWPEPAFAGVQLSISGQSLQRLVYPLPSIDVTTPFGPGYFSDTAALPFGWLGATTLRIIAFSDKDGDGSYSGTPLYSIVARDVAVPVGETTWGRVKSLYRD